MAKLFNLNSEDLVTYKWMAHHLESIADETKRVARYMRIIKLPSKEQAKFVKLYQELEQNYLDMMKAYYTQDRKIALDIASLKEQMVEKCDKFYDDNPNTKWIAHLVNRTKTLISAIHEIGRVIYQ